MKTVIIDNYDSFTYNLVHYIEEILGQKPDVLKNDAFLISDLDTYDIIVLSPGPGLPKDAGLLMDVIDRYHKTKIILGVCLGHQALGEYFGGELQNLPQVYHGVDCSLQSMDDPILYKNIDNPSVGRYHSWVVKKETFPSDLLITSEDQNGQVMSLKHRNYPLHGVQFHPESVLSSNGKEMLRNFFEHYSLSKLMK